MIFGFGGNFGDCSAYHGSVVGVPEAGGAMSIFELDTAPGESQGAVWMGGAAPAVDGSGNVWVAVGNGSVTSPGGPYDDSDSVIELSSSLGLEQFFAPSDWYSDNATDRDLGFLPHRSCSPMARFSRPANPRRPTCYPRRIWAVSEANKRRSARSAALMSTAAAPWSAMSPTCPVKAA